MPLDAGTAMSFWPTREGLLKILADYGFTRTPILEDNTRHRDGPAITLAARPP